MDPNENESQGTEEVIAQEPIQETGDSINPAWNPVMEKLPPQYHSVVTPFFQQWDKNYQEGISKVHSQYEGWKSFQDQGVNPEQVNYALSVLDAIQNNPQEVIKALQEYFPDEEVSQTLTEQQGQENPSFDFNSVPELQQMKQMVDTMAQFLVQQRQSEQEKAESARLEQERTKLAETYGDFDQSWVAAQMLNNDKLSMEDAVKMYKQWENDLLQKRIGKPGPKVIGAGGAAPSSQVQPKQLDDAGRRALAIQIMQQAAQGG